jgi:hypothetical protein
LPVKPQPDFNCRKAITSIATLTGADQRALLDKIGQIAGRGGKGSPRNCPVISRTQPALKPIRPFAEQAKQSLFLPFVDLAAQAIE